MHTDAHFNPDGTCDCRCPNCYDEAGHWCICPDCDPTLCVLHPIPGL